MTGALVDTDRPHTCVLMSRVIDRQPGRTQTRMRTFLNIQEREKEGETAGGDRGGGGNIGERERER